MYNHQESQESEIESTGTVISNNPVVNLTSTIASLSLLFALFLCFADQRSRTVRRFSVQSVGLGLVWVVAEVLIWIFGALFAVIPFVGGVFSVLAVIAACAVFLVNFYFRVKMMFHAYRGVAYVLPVIGEMLRRFE